MDLTATHEAEIAYGAADFVVIIALTSSTQYLNTSAVEKVIGLVTKYKPETIIVIKSITLVGNTKSIRKNRKKIFSPEFLRESKVYMTMAGLNLLWHGNGL